MLDAIFRSEAGRSPFLAMMGYFTGAQRTADRGDQDVGTTRIRADVREFDGKEAALPHFPDGLDSMAHRENVFQTEKIDH